jgi:ADP-heptose:LPS heptosyltransferase
MIHWLSRCYRRIGIHTAPPGTLFFWINALVRRVVHRRIFGFVSGDAYTRSKYGGIPYYDIGRVRRTRPVSGLALVYFMGAGDYLMTTPLIRALHLAYPDLPIYAYASSHADHVNSPLIIQLLKVNPFVDRVFSYRGRSRAIWTDYDFSDALKDIPKDFVILPVFYDVEPVVYHRALSVLETFSLPVDLPIPVPIAYQAEMSPAAEILLRSIRSKAKAASPAGIVCTHFGARSSGYEYPHAAALIGRLVKLGFLVVTFSPVETEHENIVPIDISRISPIDSIELLRALATDPASVSVISVNSLMWPISAALNIPNLGLHTFEDPALHQYLYPNIFVITQYTNPQISPSRWFFAPPNAYALRPLNGDTLFTDYNPDFVIDCFQTMVGLPAT